MRSPRIIFSHMVTFHMSASKTSGHTDQLIGSVKENVGKVFNKDMEAKGIAQKHKGDGEVRAAKVKDTVQGTGKSLWGQMTGDKSKEVEGDLQKDTA